MNPRILFAAFLAFILSNILFGQPVERIFYSSFSPQDWDIYISKDSGKSFNKFTDHPSLDYDAAISPDGKWVVFTSERSGIAQLYAKPVEGNQPPVLLVISNSFQDQAAFSPDGRMLAFVGSHQGNADVYLMPFTPDSIQDISGARNLTNHRGGDFRPSFSPDGKHIAFSSDRGHKVVPHPHYSFARQRIGDIYSVGINGENLQRLTDCEFWDGSPIWSEDGSKIIFYSARNGSNSIFEMNADGSNQHQIVEYSGPQLSPKIIGAEKLAFTTWSSERDFKIMQYDKVSGEIFPLIENGPDLMFNLDIHPKGLMVFHGGKYPERNGTPGNFGFDGDLFAKLPDSLWLADKSMEIIGVRRAFVAPPLPGNTLLVYDASDIQSFFDFLEPVGYLIFLLPLLMIVLFFAGIYLGIRNRKIIPFWKYLIFCLLVVLACIITGGIFFYIDSVDPMPINHIRLIMILLTVLTASLAWWFYRRSNHEKLNEQARHRLSSLYYSLFAGLTVFSLCCALLINYFVNSTLNFYQVDYISGEKKLLFQFEKENNINPGNFQVIDSKITHDGKALLFTTGSFRGRAHTQGDIWKYDFETKNIIKLSDSPHNDGFADLSEDGKMIFRSGRSGDFDIYLKSSEGVTNLTGDIHRDNFPAISKQGDKIVFASDRLRADSTYKTMDIFLIELLGDNKWSEPERISIGEGQNAHAHFSPDGNWVIYATEGFGINDEQALIQPIIFSPQMYGEIEAYNIHTKARIRLTHNKWEDGAPLWVN